MAEQSFDIVEKLSEELGEKEDRIMALEKRLAEEIEEKKKLFDYKEIIEMCGKHIFDTEDSNGCEHAEWLEEMIYEKIVYYLECRFDGSPIYDRLMPIAIEILHTHTGFEIPFYITIEPLQTPHKNFQSQAFLTLKEVVEKLIE